MTELADKINLAYDALAMAEECVYEDYSYLAWLDNLEKQIDSITAETEKTESFNMELEYVLQEMRSFLENWEQNSA